MTYRAWMASLEQEFEQGPMAQAKQRWLKKARQQRVITQKQLEDLVEVREYLQVWRAQTLEKAQEIIDDLKEELDWDEQKLKAALEGGAMVEPGEWHVEDALPEERQMQLPFGPQLVFVAAG